MLCEIKFDLIAWLQDLEVPSLPNLISLVLLLPEIIKDSFHTNNNKDFLFFIF